MIVENHTIRPRFLEGLARCKDSHIRARKYEFGCNMISWSGSCLWAFVIKNWQCYIVSIRLVKYWMCIQRCWDLSTLWFSICESSNNRLRFLCSNQSLLQLGGQNEVRWWPCSPELKVPELNVVPRCKGVMIDPLWNQLGTCKMRIRRLLYVWYWEAFLAGATLVSAGLILNAIVAWVWHVFLCTRATCRFVVLQMREAMNDMSCVIQTLV